MQHRVAAEAFLEFMRSRKAQDIYAGYGFSSAN
ncbi:MAG: substrate-binding domain-containing protein [Nitrospirae bacterium]|nr:substrate-binding domain-containing protein [Nitrospirota bacterium]